MLSPDFKDFSTSSDMPEVKSSTSSVVSKEAGLTSSRSSFLIKDLNARRVRTPESAGKSRVAEGYTQSLAPSSTGDSRSIVQSFILSSRRSFEFLILSPKAGDNLSALLNTSSHEP